MLWVWFVLDLDGLSWHESDAAACIIDLSHWLCCQQILFIRHASANIAVSTAGGCHAQ
jgi:hypothetical protein